MHNPLRMSQEQHLGVQDIIRISSFKIQFLSLTSNSVYIWKDILLNPCWFDLLKLCDASNAHMAKQCKSSPLIMFYLSIQIPVIPS